MNPGSRHHRRRWTLGLLTLAVVALGGAAAWFVPDMLRGPIARAERAYAAERWSESETIARQVLKAAPRDLDARRILARSLSRQRRDGEAIPIFRSLTITQTTAEDLFLIGTALDRKGDKELAQDALESARKLDPKHVETLNALLTFYESNDELTSALTVARMLAEIRGQAAIGQVHIARLCEALDSPKDARDAWNAALAADPGLSNTSTSPAEARRHLARISLQLGQADEALKLLASDTTREALWLISRAHLQKSDPKQAQTALAAAGGPEAFDPLRPEPSPYVGAAKCAECHEAIATAQGSSRHAKTYHMGSDLAGVKIPAQPLTDPGAADVNHTFRRLENGRVEVETKAGASATYKALIDFAFGSGDRGLTFVGRDHAGNGRELRLSHYGESNVWDLTFGQNPHPRDEGDFVGRSLTQDGVRRCVGCHVTHPGLGIDREGPEAKDGAIGCERCHGPGGNHLKAVEAEFPDLAIARPKAVAGAGIVGLCGNCHKPKGELEKNSPAVVRFQAATLAWSKCFTQSFNKLDCVTCHDPHRNAATTPAHYESRCLSCHSATPPPGTEKLGLRQPDPRMKRVICSVNSKNGCVGCHMPADTQSIAHSLFTNHEIGIHRAPPAAAVGQKEEGKPGARGE